MKSIAKWTLVLRKWSLLWWSVAMFGLIFVNMIFYPSFKNQATDLQQSFETIPDTVKQFIGGSDFFSPVGFLNGQIFFLMLPLLLSVLAIGLGSSLLAKDEQDKTIEALLARPVSRAKLLAGKSIAGIAIVGVAALAACLTTAVTAKLVDLDVPSLNIFAATLAALLMALSFGAVAFVVTSFGKARSASIGIAAAFALGGYIVSSLAGTVSWLEGFSKLLPFHYYQSEAILRGDYNWLNIVYFVVIIMLSGICSYVAFRRRDIR